MILPAVSIKQPWPHTIFHCGKDTENRSWPLPKKFWNRTILLHSGKALDESGYYWLSLEAGYPLPPARELQKGGITGAVTFSGMPPTTSVWADEGFCHWHIERFCHLRFHPCAGRLGFFDVDYPFSLPEGW
jgi:hypothetical protein